LGNTVTASGKDFLHSDENPVDFPPGDDKGRKEPDHRGAGKKHHDPFFHDADNTLLDNDHIITDFMRHLERTFGQERAGRCFDIFRWLRDELGYADYLGNLQRYRIEYPHDTNLLTVSNYFVDYPFANHLYPKSLDVVEHVKK
jgi:hypothetical protein